jgi:hypothetical protein
MKSHLDTAFSCRCGEDTPQNREEAVTELKAVSDMGDSYTTDQCLWAIREIQDGGNFHKILDQLVQWSEDCMDEIMENQC